MKRWIYVLVPLLILGSVIGWRIRTNAKKKADDAKARDARLKAPPTVTVAPALVRDIVHTYDAVGAVEAPSFVRIAPKITGRVETLTLRQGQPVRKGDVVATIDPSEILAQAGTARAQVAEAQSRLTQAQLTANPTNVSVATQIEQQQAAQVSAEADDRQTRANYAAQVASARSAITDAQGRVDNAEAAIANADAAIRSAKSNLQNADVRFTRTNDLYKQGFIAAQDVDDARTTVKVQQSAVDVAQGQRDAAVAARNSALAQKRQAQSQASIVARKGRADIAASDARLKQARSSVRLAQANRAQRPAYQANLAALRSTVEAAQAQQRNIEAQLADTTLRSPIDGFITARYLDPGAIAAPGTPVVAVQAIATLYVTASVPEEINQHIHIGQDAQMTFDALPGQTFVGKVAFVNAAADPTSHLIQVQIALANPQGTVRPGMFARVHMVTELFRNVVVVPREAVRTGKNGPTVTIVDAQNKASIRGVQTGPEDSTGISIVRGIRGGENVVTVSVRPVKDGETVKLDSGEGGGKGKLAEGNGREAGAPGGNGQGSGGQGGGGAPTATAGDGSQGGNGAGASSGGGTGSTGTSIEPGGGSSAGSGQGAGTGVNGGNTGGTNSTNSTPTGTSNGSSGAPAPTNTPGQTSPGLPATGSPSSGNSPGASPSGSGGTGTPGTTGNGGGGTGSVFGGSGGSGASSGSGTGSGVPGGTGSGAGSGTGSGAGSGAGGGGR